MQNTKYRMSRNNRLSGIRLASVFAVLVFFRSASPSFAESYSVSELSSQLSHAESEQRRLAAVRLGEMGPSAKDSIPALMAVVNDPNEGVRTAVAVALSKIGLPPRSERLFLQNRSAKEQALPDERSGADDLVRTLQGSARNKDRVEHLIVQGSHYQDQQLYKKAIEAYTEVIRLDPLNALAYAALGGAYIQDGEFAKGKDALVEAIRLDPTQAGAHSLLGTVHIVQGDFPLAIEAYKRSIQLAPNYIGFYKNLASLYFDRQEWNPLIEVANQGLKINPNEPAFHFWLIRAYLKIGEKESATMSIARFLHYSKQDPSFLEELASKDPFYQNILNNLSEPHTIDESALINHPPRTVDPSPVIPSIKRQPEGPRIEVQKSRTTSSQPKIGKYTSRWIIVEPRAVLFSAPSDSSTPIGEFYRGAVVEVIESKRGWHRVEKPDQGYLRGESLKPYR